MPCVAKVGNLSIPDGTHLVEKWAGRVRGGRSTERTSQSGVPGVQEKKTSKPIAHVSKMWRQRHAASCHPDLVCGVVVSCLPENATACLPVRIGGGRAENVWRVGSSGFILFA